MKIYPVRKRIRHAIYVKALELYMIEDERSFMGLCGFIKSAIRQCKIASVYDFNDINPYNNMERYPEIKKHEPAEYRRYWFPLNNATIRIEILKEAIELTKR